jgi:putative membrane protein
MKNEKKLKRIAILISIVLPLAVAILFGVKIEGVDLSFLPRIYAAINGATAIVLVLAYIAVKRKKKKLHQDFINTAVVLSVCFLLMYVLYHATSDSTIYGDLNHNGILEDSEALALGSTKFIYYFILISHIILSIIITPFVCFTYLRGWLGDYEGHKKLTRITFPLWMYVAVTGVLVYAMISPYYA